MSSRPLLCISSMATRQLLAELTATWSKRTGHSVELTSVGGVDAARRVVAGEAFDVVVLANHAITQLTAAGAVAREGHLALVHSGVAACVKAGARCPPFASAQQVRDAVLAASGVGYSTGPSGKALLRLFEQWGVADLIRPKLVQAPAGVPVASLVASGEVALGFQQLSELIHVPGIDIVGPLPQDIQITTTFTGAVCARASAPDVAANFLRFLASPDAAVAKRQQGMTPA